MKHIDLSLSFLFLISSVLFANDINTIDKNNTQSSAQTAAAVLQGEQDFQTKCVNVSDPTLTCGGSEAEQTLKTAESTAKTSAIAALAGSVGGSSGVSTLGSLGELAGVAIACAQIKCDASDSTKSTTQTTCISGCVEDPPTLANYTKCIAGCPSAYSSDTTRDCDREVTDTSGSTTPYGTNIKTYKSSAKILQTQCRSLCKAVATQSASFWTQASALAGQLSGLQGTIKGGKNSSTTTSPDTTTQNNQNPTYTPNNYNNSNSGLGDLCSGKTGDALAQCNCTSLGGTWSDKTRCSEGSTTNDSSYGSGSSGSGTNDPAGTGVNNNSAKSSRSTAIGGGSFSGTGVGVDSASSSSKDKNANGNTYSASSGLKNGESNNGSTSSDLLSNSSAGTKGSDDIIDNSYPDIVNKDEKIFDVISKIYTNKYNGKELGFFALESDKKKKVSKTRNNLK